MSHSEKSLDLAQSLMTATLENGGNIDIKCSSNKRAQAIRFACYGLRKQLLKQSCKVYEIGDVAYNCTPYDTFRFTIDGVVLKVRSEPEELTATDPKTGKEIRL